MPCEMIAMAAADEARRRRRKVALPAWWVKGLGFVCPLSFYTPCLEYFVEGLAGRGGVPAYRVGVFRPAKCLADFF
jgi:hypothetical protein